MGRQKPQPAVVLKEEPKQAARQAGLRYVRDGEPGIRRRASGGGFSYVRDAGRPVHDAETLRRIKALAIPPAWTEVWICGDADGHIQATGRDARGRKQYRYHPRWRVQRDETKYGRMLAFGKVLPRIRARVQADLARPGLSRDKVLATVVRLLETTLIRVGNEEYARTNRHYGLTTLRDNHVQIRGAEVRFSFRGKSGKYHEIAVNDPRLAPIVRRCRDIPGYELFQYIDDDGQRQTVDSADVNEYIRAVAGEAFTAKDFRTWSGTVLAAVALQEMQKVDTHALRKKNIVQAIERVAERLGNTTAVCRKCYVHPAVLDAYMDGEALRLVRQRAQRQLRERAGTLPPEETAVLSLLQRRLAGDKRGDRLENLLRRSVRRSPARAARGARGRAKAIRTAARRASRRYRGGSPPARSR